MHFSSRLNNRLACRPHICHFFSTNVLFGLNFFHMEARKISQNFSKFYKISQYFSKIPPHDNFFSTNIIRDICDKYELCLHEISFRIFQHFALRAIFWHFCEHDAIGQLPVRGCNFGAINKHRFLTAVRKILPQSLLEIWLDT